MIFNIVNWINSSTDIFTLVSEMHNFCIKKKHGILFINIYFSIIIVCFRLWRQLKNQRKKFLNCLKIFSGLKYFILYIVFSSYSVKKREIMCVKVKIWYIMEYILIILKIIVSESHYSFFPKCYIPSQIPLWFIIFSSS